MFSFGGKNLFSLQKYLEILANKQLDALFHVFIYFISIHVFENHSAHHQEVELY
jgi:hypothetical protein